MTRFLLASLCDRGKSPARNGIHTHELSVLRPIFYRCAIIAAFHAVVTIRNVDIVILTISFT